MVRVLASTTAGAGHFGPVVPFARACAAAGHEVRVAAPASFAAVVREAGFEHAPFDDVDREVMGAVFGRLPSLSREEANAVVVGEVFGRLDAQAALPRLVELVAEWRPDVVLREPCELGSLAAARLAGVRHATVAISVSAMTAKFATVLAAPLAELDDLAGLPQGACVAAMESAPTLTCVPAVLDGALGRPATTGAQHRFDVRPSPMATGSLPATWGDPGHPLVYVSFGSVTAAVGDLARIYPQVLAALAELPVRVLMTTGRGVDPADLGMVPANAHVEAWWPQEEVLPRAAAAVGHGGFGTTMGALAAGVPQLVVPLFSADQFLNAEHVSAVGAGLHLPDGPADLAHLPALVTRLVTEPAFGEAARAVAAEMAGHPPVSAAVHLLESGVATPA